MSPIAIALQGVHARIRAAARQAGRDPATISLLAVSKTVPAGQVLAALAAGQGAFGENYVQEALDKIQRVRAARPSDAVPPAWHLIGPLQSNKTRQVAEQMDWVHSVDRLKLAQRLSAQRPSALPPLNVCLQVNISGEPSKHGCTLAALPELAQAVAELPGLRLRGLMAIPEPCAGLEAQRVPLRALRHAWEALRASGLALDTLSMGMSADLEAAVLEGSTLLRVGTAIFGARQAGQKAAGVGET